ncbi:MAG: 4Fe-4S binding protein [Pseudomonadota bacterium]
MRTLALTTITLLFFIHQCAFAKEDATDIPADIHKIFPTATRVGAEHTDIPVTPVYQLQQLLGYAFESKHFASFLGFSGKPINMLIGIDEKGRFIDFVVLEHAEPIFLHGYDEQPMLDYIDQYIGHNVKDRFIIDGNAESGSDAVYFDGISRATVSVLVINDTIITSALKVARAKLDGFLPPSNKILREDYFELLSFEQLVERGYITEQTIFETDFDDLEPEIKTAGEDFFDREIGVFSRHYYLMLSIPVIGKNILGETEFQRLNEELKPGEIALMVLHTNGYSFISDDFIPQTMPENLRLRQGEMPLPARDMDFYNFHDESFASTLPDFMNLKILRLKSQTGLDLTLPLDFSIALTYSPSFLDRDDYFFNVQGKLSDELFMDNPDANVAKPKPLWMQLWQSRSIEIGILVLYLGLLTYFFVFQERYVKHSKLVHQVRFTSLFFIIFFIGYYTQGQLSVVNIYTLLLALYDGFQIEVFLLDPILFILWVFVFVTLFLFGRGLFCGWLCPFGSMQELAAHVATKLNIKQIKIKDNHHKAATKIKYFLLLGIVFSAFYSFTLAESLAEAEPFKTAITMNFVRYWPFALYAIVLVLLSLKIHKFYCRYLCPLGAGLAVLGRYPIFKLLRRREECGNPCHLCRQKKCGINAINKDGSIDYTECIQCLECVVTLDNKDICKIDKYKKRAVKTRVRTIDPVSQ